ncbi:MAG: selenocysteine-specific translation elongation factor [Anaerolineales bacterium]|nr:MAG: selenocysteine-specific translation elongation factor [Anaerolineales bacterium]
MFVIGTAGHVDHGKSTLVHALTGINPDRLPEERVREMTIDLGFAWLTLPSGREVSIVDVPGHEDFIKNMLAGIGGIDLALLVVAADESVMPQTREHLAILDLLRIARGVVALTKIDLVADPEWLALVKEEVREELQGTVLQGSAVVPVSAVTGAGLQALLAEVDRVLDHAEPRRDLGRPRLAIDRVFTISGFGTVVTGTLIDGHLAVGDEVQIVPGGVRARIRGLQTHKVSVRVAQPGVRVAVNLSGVPTGALERGQVLTRPGELVPTTLIDARLVLLPGAPKPLKHNAVVDFYSGAARVASHVRLLDTEKLEPGRWGWVQFRLSRPVAVVRGDRYVVRLASPSLTLGGGAIVQPHPRRRYKRFRPELLARLEALSTGVPEDVLLQLLSQDRILELRELIQRSALPPEEAASTIHELLAQERIVVLSDQMPLPGPLPRSAVGVLLPSAWQGIVSQMAKVLETYHRIYPLRSGMPREELKSRLHLGGQLFNQVVDRAVREKRIAARSATVALVGHKPDLMPEQRHAVARVMARFRANPSTPPSYSDVERTLGHELLQFLLDQAQLIKASDAVLFDSESFADMERRVVAYIREHQSMTVAQARDLLGTSRKYALGLLGYLDQQRVTKRVGDFRVLR